MPLELGKSWLFSCPAGKTSTEKPALEKMPGKTQKKIKCFSFQKSEYFWFKTGNSVMWLPFYQRTAWEVFCSKSGKPCCYQTSLGCQVLANVPSNPELSCAAKPSNKSYKVCPIYGEGKLHVLLLGKNLSLYHEELLTNETFGGLCWSLHLFHNNS